MGTVQARAHQPRLLHVGAGGGRRRVLRGDGQAARPDRGRRQCAPRGRDGDRERSIGHHGDTTLFISDQLRERGLGYASAVAMEEVTLLDFNRDRGARPPLVALYPKEGTFSSDNPFVVLDADWVSSHQRRAAEVLRRFLAQQITPERARRAGFRPADGGNGTAEPKRLLGLPEPRVLARIREAGVLTAARKRPAGA